MFKYLRPFFQKSFIWLIIMAGLILPNLCSLGVQTVHAQERETDVPVCMIDGTVQISTQATNAIKSAIKKAIPEVDFKNAECFALIDLRNEGEWFIVTLVGVIGVDQGSEWKVSSNGVWSDLAIIHFSDSSASAAIAGTVYFSELLAQIPDSILSQEAKNALDPLVNQAVDMAALDTYIFPFENNRLVKYFRFHFDTSENFTFWTGANSKAVDLGSDGDTNVNHAPNRLFAVASGTVRQRCSQEGSFSSTYIAVQNDDGNKIIYAHLLKSGAPTSGTRISQGQELGALKIGSFTDGICGHATQGATSFHVHFEVPNASTLTLGDWTLNTSTGTWTRGSEIWNSGEYKQIGGSGTNNCQNTGGSGIRLYDGTLCSGNERYYSSVGFVNTSDFNDVTSSINVGDGWSVKVYEHSDRGGSSRCITGDMWNLAQDYYTSGDTGKVIDNDISSIEVFNNNNCTGGIPAAEHSVQLYKDAQYLQGYCYGDAVGSYANIDGCAGYDEATSSLLLKSGWAVRVYKERDLAGTSKCFTSNDNDLSNNTFDDGSALNDQLSSFVLYNQSSCPPLTPNIPSLIGPNDGQSFNEGETINLSWSATGNEYYGEVWGGPGGILAFGWQAGSSKNIGAQWAGYIYNWHVKARNGSDESGWSSSQTFTIRPGTPSNLSAVGVSCNQINISWGDNSGNEEGYRIYRNGTLVVTLGSGVTSYQNTGLASNTNYSFLVKAYRGNIESNPSNTANATTQTCGGGSNDNITFSKNVSLPYTDVMDTSTATQSGSDPAFISCNRAPGLASVWYRLVPSSNMSIEIDTNGSNYDTMLGVFSGSPANLSEVKCDDDSGEGVRSALRVSLSAGSTYYIVASEYSSPISSFGTAISTFKPTPDIAALSGGSLKLHVHRTSASPQMSFGSGTNNIVIYRGGAWLPYDFANGTSIGGVWSGAPSANCIPAPMDYDGDGIKEFTQLCSGAWMFYNDNGSYNKGIWIGNIPGDIPVPADYNGDGTDDVVVFRAGAWLFYDFATGANFNGIWTGAPAHWLGGTSIPVPIDYDGDGDADFSVYAGGPWHFYNANGSYNKGVWTGGTAGNIPVAGNYDSNPIDEIVVFSSGAWQFFDFTTGAYLGGVWTGLPTNVMGGVSMPAPVDYNYDGRLDFAIYAGGPWHFYNSNGSYNKGIWTGAVPSSIPISKRALP